MCVCVLTHDNKNYIIDIVIEKGLPHPARYKANPCQTPIGHLLYYTAFALQKKGRNAE